jgi:hypothetical protein
LTIEDLSTNFISKSRDSLTSSLQLETSPSQQHGDHTDNFYNEQGPIDYVYTFVHRTINTINRPLLVVEKSLPVRNSFITAGGSLRKANTPQCLPQALSSIVLACIIAFTASGLRLSTNSRLAYVFRNWAISG